jgi:hypothetical protein
MTNDDTLLRAQLDALASSVTGVPRLTDDERQRITVPAFLDGEPYRTRALVLRWDGRQILFEAPASAHLPRLSVLKVLWQKSELRAVAEQFLAAYRGA